MFRLIDQDECLIQLAGNSRGIPDDVLTYFEKIIVEGLLETKRAIGEEANLVTQKYV